MMKAEYARKLHELDRLLNDPDVPMEPSRVWTLLAEISHEARIANCVSTADATQAAETSTGDPRLEASRRRA